MLPSRGLRGPRHPGRDHFFPEVSGAADFSPNSRLSSCCSEQVRAGKPVHAHLTPCSLLQADFCLGTALHSWGLWFTEEGSPSTMVITSRFPGARPGWAVAFFTSPCPHPLAHSCPACGWGGGRLRARVRFVALLMGAVFPLLPADGDCGWSPPGPGFGWCPHPFHVQKA